MNLSSFRSQLRLKVGLNKICNIGKTGASDFIISTISEGYKIPFIDSPKPAEFINNKSAIHNSEFVTDSLRELIASKRVVDIALNLLW